MKTVVIFLIVIYTRSLFSCVSLTSYNHSFKQVHLQLCYFCQLTFSSWFCSHTCTTLKIWQTNQSPPECRSFQHVMPHSAPQFRSNERMESFHIKCQVDNTAIIIFCAQHRCLCWTAILFNCFLHGVEGNNALLSVRFITLFILVPFLLTLHFWT